MCKRLVEDEYVEDVHGILIRHHQCLISRLLVEAVGITANAIAQAGIASREEDPINLQRFRAHHPPTFTGGGDQMVTDHWFMQIEKVLEVMECNTPNVFFK